MPTAAPAPAPATAPMKLRRLSEPRAGESSVMGGLRLMSVPSWLRKSPRIIRPLPRFRLQAHDQIIHNCHRGGWRQVDSAYRGREHPLRPADSVSRMLNMSSWTVAEIEGLFARPFLDLLLDAQRVHRLHFAPNTVQMSTLLSIKTGACPEDCAY